MPSSEMVPTDDDRGGEGVADLICEATPLLLPELTLLPAGEGKSA